MHFLACFYKNKVHIVYILIKLQEFRSPLPSHVGRNPHGVFFFSLHNTGLFYIHTVNHKKINQHEQVERRILSTCSDSMCLINPHLNPAQFSIILEGLSGCFPDGKQERTKKAED